ncbi:MAG TPA: hypothetical protein VFJ17_03025 [Mycobacteriales bacterium]|jgi:hypothetical protein|nr:hypothetical protein [Mycobacteriales bacterium]
MYVWIWRRLPGGLPGKLAGSLVLLAAALALLFFLVFPWAERRLPFQDITVNNGPSPQPTVSASP